VEAFDTNVVVRLIVHDDAEQCRLAEQAFRSAVSSGGAWIASVVLVEVSWVLRVAYKFDRATIAAAQPQRLRAGAAVLAAGGRDDTGS
jgi:predicted nucleic-acid-binding protein